MDGITAGAVLGAVGSFGFLLMFAVVVCVTHPPIVQRRREVPTLPLTQLETWYRRIKQQRHNSQLRQGLAHITSAQTQPIATVKTPCKRATSERPTAIIPIIGSEPHKVV